MNNLTKPNLIVGQKLVFKREMYYAAQDENANTLGQGIANVNDFVIFEGIEKGFYKFFVNCYGRREENKNEIDCENYMFIKECEYAYKLIYETFNIMPEFIQDFEKLSIPLEKRSFELN